MKYDFMRLIVMFDLPVKTNKDKRKYSTFRKYLISKGYIMLQFSVYVKILNNRDAAELQIDALRKNVPQKGHIRTLMLTEKQYARMEIILGGKSRKENIFTIDPFIEL